MIDIGYAWFVLLGGFIMGLIVGIVRKHGILWTIADSLVAGVLSIAIVFGWFGLFAAWPAGREFFDEFGKRNEFVKQFLQMLTLIMPVIGILIGLVIVRMLRRRFGKTA